MGVEAAGFRVEPHLSQSLLLDTDVIVDVLRRHEPAVRALSMLLESHQLHICILTEMEIVSGCRNKQEASQAAQLMERFELIVPDATTMRTALDLLREYRFTFGISIPDAIIAATALGLDCPLVTRNLKHYRDIEALKLQPFEFAD